MAKVYIFNDEGYYVGIGESIPHPFNLGDDSLPNNSTYLEVLEEKEGFMIKHVNENEELPERWIYEKVLTIEEQKISGEISLENGEYVEDGILITVEPTSVLHIWNTETHTWDVSEERVANLKETLLEKIEEKREVMLFTGHEFEEGKLVRGRDKDLLRSKVIYDNFKDDLMLNPDGSIIPVMWKYSNNTFEKIDTLERITVVYGAISKYVLAMCTIGGQVELTCRGLTDWEELLAFDVEAEWNKYL